ncbi:MAG TPA: DNA primase [Clostridia bacterium]|nr:DNA primase [Clostridia bacterium]
MANYYPDEVIEEIIEKNDIVDVVSDYVKINRKGKDYFGLCPFHNEKTPSFSVVPSKQIYYCFGCGKGGNVLNFISGIENVEYIDAIKMMADRASVTLPESNDSRERESSGYIKKLVEINTEAARFFHEKLMENPDAQAYLRNRKIKDSTIRKFGIGFAPDSWDAVLKHLKGKGYNEKDITTAGLAKKGSTSYYDSFRNRIMFPIIDIRNRVIGFGGRILSGEGAKYINSPETPAYNKSSSLYGINIAKNSKAEKIIIVEGYMDCVAIHQAGFQNCVASLGTALTRKQASMLKKLVPEIIIAYDMDQAGRNATIRGLDLIASIGCDVKILEMPEGKDPDEFIKINGREAFGKLVDNSLPIVEYKAKILRSRFNINDVDGRRKYLNGVAKAISQVNNAIDREVYIDRIARVYGIPAESIKEEVSRHLGESEAVITDRSRKLGTAIHIESDNEIKNFMSIAAIICARPEFIDVVTGQIGDGFIDNESLSNLFGKIIARVESKGISDAAIIMNELGEGEREIFSSEVALTETSADIRRTLDEKIAQYKKAVINRRISGLTAELDKKGSLDEGKTRELQAELAEAFEALRKLKRK